MIVEIVGLALNKRHVEDGIPAYGAVKTVDGEYYLVILMLNGDGEQTEDPKACKTAVISGAKGEEYTLDTTQFEESFLQ